MTYSHNALFALYGLTALNWTIHWYTQMVTYRLFPQIGKHMTGTAFVTYHRAYQSRLVWAIYLPWFALMAASVALAISPPVGEAMWVWLLLLLNGAIGVISFVMAVPAHSRIDREARLGSDDARDLLRANFVRLLTASASLALCSVLAFRSFVG